MFRVLTANGLIIRYPKVAFSEIQSGWLTCYDERGLICNRFAPASIVAYGPGDVLAALDTNLPAADEPIEKAINWIPQAAPQT